MNRMLAVAAACAALSLDAALAAVTDPTPTQICVSLASVGYDRADAVMSAAGLPRYGLGTGDEQVDTLLAADAEGNPDARAAIAAWASAEDHGCH